MGRLNIKTAIPSLDELIPQYAIDKSQLDTLKKVCDSENAIIKEQMYNSGVDTHTAGGFVAKRTVSVRETLNEEKLIDVLRKHNIDGVIKTREYVDMDALESYLYNHEQTNEFASDLASCKTTTEVVQLRITKAKKQKEE
jgi:chromosome segregation ATPase